jgi:hypothetical protein
MTTDVMTTATAATTKNNLVSVFVPPGNQTKEVGTNRIATPEKNEAVLTTRFDDPTYYG